MTYVNVKPALLRWALDRSGTSVSTAALKFPNLPAWLKGRGSPSLPQLERFARATHTPVGFLFLDAPPTEEVPIPDFRTIGGSAVARPSPGLLETIYLCQQRQEWYRQYSLTSGDEPLAFVGSAKTSDGIEQVASRIRHAIGFDLEARRSAPTWADALRLFVDQADALGVLVMASSVVGSNTHWPLDPREFRGFALSDDRAPLVFVNGADSKSAQMFTLAHELAHLWVDRSALSDSPANFIPENAIERWCNNVAAELLVPLRALRREYRADDPLDAEVQRLSKKFKVSSLVILRRIRDAGGLSKAELSHRYDEEVDRLEGLVRGGGGGHYYRAQIRRVGRRFTAAVVASALEGQTLHRDAMRLLGVAKPDTMVKLGRSVGVG